MVTQTKIDRQVKLELNTLSLMLGDLPQVAEEWDTLSSGSRASWSHDWDQQMGTLKIVLERAYRDGAMTRDEQGRYTDLLQKLDDALPIIECLDLMRPTVSLQTLKSA